MLSGRWYAKCLSLEDLLQIAVWDEPFAGEADQNIGQLMSPSSNQRMAPNLMQNNAALTSNQNTVTFRHQFLSIQNTSLIKVCEQRLAKHQTAAATHNLQPVAHLRNTLHQLLHDSRFAIVVRVPTVAELAEAFDRQLRPYPRLFPAKTCARFMEKHTVSVPFRDLLSVEDFCFDGGASSEDACGDCDLNMVVDLNAKYRPRRLPFMPEYMAIHAPALICAHDVGVTQLGNLRSNDQAFIPSGVCANGNHLGTDPSPQAPRIGQLFVISQPWCELTYHAMIECLPRVAQNYVHLMERSDIKIHVPGDTGSMPAEFLRFLGFEDSRFVTGAVYAESVFVPEPSVHCGGPTYIGLQRLREIIHQRLIILFPRLKEERHGKPPLIVLIKRTIKRFLFNHDELEMAIRESFGDRYEVQVFRDDPTPSFTDTMKLFYQAAVVIGPHGAGFANLIASKKETVVIEYLVADNPNFCFETLTYHLRQKYFGTISSEESSYDGAIYANIDDAIEIISLFGPVVKRV